MPKLLNTLRLFYLLFIWLLSKVPRHRVLSLKPASSTSETLATVLWPASHPCYGSILSPAKLGFCRRLTCPWPWRRNRVMSKFCLYWDSMGFTIYGPVCYFLELSFPHLVSSTKFAWQIHVWHKLGVLISHRWLLFYPQPQKDDKLLYWILISKWSFLVPVA